MGYNNKYCGIIIYWSEYLGHSIQCSDWH